MCCAFPHTANEVPLLQTQGTIFMANLPTATAITLMCLLRLRANTCSRSCRLVAGTPGIQMNGQAVCWGRNMNGELGADIVSDDSVVPLEVAGFPTFQSISAGTVHTCAIANTSALCWG